MVMEAVVFGWGPPVDSYELGNKISGSIKMGKIFDYLKDSRLWDIMPSSLLKVN
jgi:hypothetical protein